MLSLLRLCLLAGLAAGVAAGSPVVKHIVVLMVENRAFDHIFGHASTPEWPINGLQGNESNPMSTENAQSKRVAVSDDCPMVNVCDPGHATPVTTLKLFGAAAVAAGNFSTARMNGFVECEKRHPDYCDVMRGFAPGRLPVITALAQEYALMDHFFASHPGPTWPNRMYALSATSAGSTETSAWFHNVPGAHFWTSSLLRAAHGRTTTTTRHGSSSWRVSRTSRSTHGRSPSSSTMRPRAACLPSRGSIRGEIVCSCACVRACVCACVRGN